MITQWNDLEDDALQGLPIRAQIIYLRGLRRYMNYSTGIVGGSERRISLKMLGEISEESINRQLHQPNKKQVIVSLDQLKKAGLIERIEDKDYLIFFLPKADTNNSVQNNHGTTTAQPRHNHGTDCGTEKNNDKVIYISNLDKDSEDNHGTGKNGTKNASAGTAAHISNTGKQVTGKSISTKKKEVISDNWQPSERCYQLIEKAGIEKDFANSLIDEFIMYWQERGEKRPGWDTTFLGNVKRNYELARKTPPAGQAKAGFIGNQPTKRIISNDDFDSKNYGQSTFELPWESIIPGEGIPAL
jgi:hypothetical protein